MGMIEEGVRLDRARGGRRKYRHNPDGCPGDAASLADRPTCVCVCVCAAGTPLKAPVPPEYELLPALDWASARDACWQEGAALAVPQSQRKAEQPTRRFAFNASDATRVDLGWLGASDAAKEGEFVTAGGAFQPLASTPRLPHPALTTAPHHPSPQLTNHPSPRLLHRFSLPQPHHCSSPFTTAHQSPLTTGPPSLLITPHHPSLRLTNHLSPWLLHRFSSPLTPSPLFLLITIHYGSPITPHHGSLIMSPQPPRITDFNPPLTMDLHNSSARRPHHPLPLLLTTLHHDTPPSLTTVPHYSSQRLPQHPSPQLPDHSPS
ncbi:hypothetical protein R5R35_003680 [Gryllus longicercus]|uniref:C-type lectin domain-containing protein n=1 Tax=Gryllus longicercus TaxID=2509291 RepID=A0AAN9YZG4_9ORTH